MKVVNLEELSRMPNGTVFSEINSPSFYKGAIGDISIDGLSIMCGHDDKWCPVKSGNFCGVLHMLSYVPLRRDSNGNAYIDGDYPFNDYAIAGTAKCDYVEDDMFVVYDKTDVIEIINALQWALTGCKSELLVRSEFIDYK